MAGSPLVGRAVVIEFAGLLLSSIVQTFLRGPFFASFPQVTQSSGGERDADKTIDAGAIEVDTFQDKKVVVLRGSVPSDAQKTNK